MNSVGGLSFELVANLSRLATDMQSMRREVSGAMKGIEGATDLAKKALVGLIGVGSVAGFAAIIKGAIDSAGALNDLAISSGMSVESLSAFAAVGRTTGTSAETIANMSAKMAKTLATANEEGKGAAQALKALGIDFDSFVKMSPDQQMLTVSKAMNQFADGTGKSAAAQALFGKEGAKNLPFLKDLAVAGELQAEVTTRQAAASDAFGDNLTMLQASGAAWSRELAMGMTPALAQGSQAFLDVFNSSGGLRDQLHGLVADGTIERWTTIGIKGLSYLIDAVIYLKRTFEVVGQYVLTQFYAATEVVTGIGNALKALRSGDFSGAWDAMKRGAENARDVVADFGKTAAETFGAETFGSQLRARMDELGSFKATAEAAKPAVDMRGVLAGNGEAAKKAASSYKSMSDAMDKYLSETTAIRAQNDKLSAGEKLVLQIRDQLEDKTLKLSYAERRSLEEKLRLTEASVRDREATEAAITAHDKLKDSLTNEVGSLQQQIDSQKEANDKLTLSAAAIAANEIAKLREAAATADRNSLLAAEKGISSDLVGIYQEQATKLRALADLKEQGVTLQAAKDANDEWKKTNEQIEQGLTDAIFRGSEAGKSIFQNLRDTLKGYFDNLILRPVIQAFMAPVAGAVGSLLGTLGLGGGTLAGGSGAGGLLGSLSNLGSLGGLLGKGGLSGLMGSASALVGKGLINLGSATGISGIAQNGINIARGTTTLGANALGGVAGSLIGGAIAGNYGKSWVTNAGAAIGSLFGPIGGIVGGIIGGVANRLFGMGPKKYGASGIEGDVLAGDFSGRTFAEWTQKGGLFRKNKRGTEYGAVSDDLSSTLDAAGADVFASVQAYAKALSLPADALKNVSFKLRVQLTDDEKANSEALAKAFGDYETTLSSTFADALAPFQEAGESLSDTLARMASLQVFGETINQFGGIFTRVAQLSVSAKEELIGFAGGMQAFIEKTKSFVDAYYSDAEKYGLAAKDLQAQLAALGITQTVGSRADFRALVEATDITTSQGREQLNALLDLAQSFAPIGDYLQQQNLTLAELAAQAPQSALLDSVLKDQEATQAYQDRLVGQVDQLNGSINAMNDAVVAAITALGGDLSAYLAAIASQTQQTARILDRFDGGDGLITTTPP